MASPDHRLPEPVDRAPRLSLTLAVLAALAVVNAIAVASIVTARREARREAERELEREIQVLARSLEAHLADLRADLLFLAHSPALAASLERSESNDPTTQRWSRLELEGALLLFMQAQPAVQSLTLTGGDGVPLVQVGRRGGSPLLIPPQSPPAPAQQRAIGRFPVAAPAPDGSSVEASLRPDGLLGLIDAASARRLGLRLGSEPPPRSAAQLTAAATVQADGWEPPVAWQLVGSEDGSQLVASVDRVTGRFRTAVLLNAGIVVLTLLTGWLLLRQSRQAEHLAAERRHQERARELERRLAHSEKLASLGRMAAGLAHEINNPLEGMSNYLGVLESDLDQEDVGAARATVGKVREGLERAAGVLRRVLVYSRPGDEARGEEIDLASVVAATVEFARGLRDLEGISIGRASGSTPARLRGDAAAFGQLVLNLVLNAAQAQGPGGQIEIGLETRGDRIVLAVADRGPGIDPRLGRRLFEPFRSTRGSAGLGLSICREIVERHGGSIRALARDGGGTIFEVDLPGAAATDVPAAASEADLETTA